MLLVLIIFIIYSLESFEIQCYSIKDLHTIFKILCYTYLINLNNPFNVKYIESNTMYKFYQSKSNLLLYILSSFLLAIVITLLKKSLCKYYHYALIFSNIKPFFFWENVFFTLNQNQIILIHMMCRIIWFWSRDKQKILSKWDAIIAKEALNKILKEEAAKVHVGDILHHPFIAV